MAAGVPVGDTFWNVMRFANPLTAAMLALVTSEEADTVQRVLDGTLRELTARSLPAVLTTEINVGLAQK